MVKQEAQNTLDDFNYHKSDLRFHLDRTTYRYRYRLVESINRFLYHALHCRIDSEYRISIGVVEETDNPSPNELGEMVTPGQFTNYLPRLILLQKTK
jgi:hypothetical protein